MTKEITKCPNCGFDFKNIPPQLELYNCECGKSQADITENYIRIISESNNEFEVAENRMNELLKLATNKGGFKFLTTEESLELEKVTDIVHAFEEVHYIFGTLKNKK